MIGPLFDVLLVNDYPSFTQVLFANDVKMASQCILKRRKWSVNLTCYQSHQMQQYIDRGQTPPLKLSLTTGIPGDFIRVVNVVKDLGVVMDYSFSPSIHCRQAASTARRMLFIKRRPSAELPVSAFTPLHYNK